jgi:hypothetical protein
MTFLLAVKQPDYNGKTYSLNQEDICHDLATGKSSIGNKLPFYRNIIF